MNPVHDQSGPTGDERALIDAAWVEAEGMARGSSNRSTGAFPGATGPAIVFSDSFPGYELIREVRRGGQGVVYQALQKSTQRRVAIKATSEGPFGDAGHKARFEREVRILGQLRHPHIVTIHDSGRAERCFYFVMDYIDGRPLDAYVRERESSMPPRAFVREVLELFARVCEAVNAAHLRGVIHRDLKPGNILIDAEGQPRVLDFGLSKWADTELDSDSAPASMTQPGQFVGSMPWASPEQAEGLSNRIDIRTDVYSLGVVLYQALTGRFPYPITGGARQVLNHIVHTEPTRPRTIAPQLNDEVETLVLKCLAKNPEDRYQTAGDLARDIRRYLADEPILARPPSGLYQLRKFARRNRPWVAGASLAVVALAGGLVVSLRQTGVANAARKQAEHAARTSHHVQAFLEQMLASADPDQARGRDTTLLREILEDADQRVRHELADEPEVAADVRFAIGSTYLSLGLYEEAAAHFQAVVDLRRQTAGEEDAFVASALSKWASALRLKGDYTAAEARMREALVLQRKVFGEDHIAVADASHTLGEILFTQSRVAGEEEQAAALLQEAEQLYQSALEMRRRLLGNDHSETARTLMTLATVALVKRDLPTADRCYGEALDILRRQSEVQPRAVATVLTQWAQLKQAQGDLAGAETMLRESLETYRGLLGPEHPTVGMAALGLARVIHSRGDALEAEPYYREAVTIQRKSADKGYLADMISGLARALQDQRKYDEALPLYEEALALYRAVNGEKHPFTCRAMGNLGRLHVLRGEFEEAESLLTQAMANLRTALGDSHPDISKTRERLVELYDAWGKPEQAAAWRSSSTSQPVE